MLDLMLAFAVGLAAGIAYFAALWLMVRWFTRGSLAPTWLLVSAAVRLALLIAVLFWIMDGRVERLLAALGGFFLVRFVALWRTRAARRQGRKMTAGPARPEAGDATDA